MHFLLVSNYPHPYSRFVQNWPCRWLATYSSSLAEQVFSFWYWKLGGTVKKSTLYSPNIETIVLQSASPWTPFPRCGRPQRRPGRNWAQRWRRSRASGWSRSAGWGNKFSAKCKSWDDLWSEVSLLLLTSTPCQVVALYNSLGGWSVWSRTEMSWN